MKKLKFLVIGLIVLFVLAGCSSNDHSYEYDNELGGPFDETEEIVYNQVPANRKVIYNVRAHISTKSKMDTYKSIKMGLEDDEWTDKEDITSNQVTLVIRIKSTRLDEFIATLGNYGEVGNYSSEASDISLLYRSYESKVETLEAEYARLNELFPDASFYDMITLNKRLAEIESEITKLTGDINKYDSLVDYSVVNLTIYEHPIVEEPAFGNAVVDALSNGWNAVVNVLKFFVITFSTLLPFTIIFVPVGLIITFIVRFKKRKKLK